MGVVWMLRDGNYNYFVLFSCLSGLGEQLSPAKEEMGISKCYVTSE